MTAHILATPIDSEYPVTLSKKAVQDLLRDEMRFPGLVITDDLTSMMGILVDETGKITRTREEAAQRALEVGTDVLLFGQLWPKKDPSHPNRTQTLDEFDAMYSHLRKTFDAPEKRPTLERAAANVLFAKAKLFHWNPLTKQEASAEGATNWTAYNELLARDRTVAEKISLDSAVLIAEDGVLINDIAQSKYFGPQRGPLAKNVLLHEAEKLTIVTPVFYPPDVLDEQLRRSWLGQSIVDVVHLVYGWRTPDFLDQASALWGERVQRLSLNDKYGEPVYQRDAVMRKAREVVIKSRKSRVVVFGIAQREHIEVLKEVAKRLPANSNSEIVVLVCIEPYFIPSELYRRNGMTFLFVSQYPDLRLAADLLLGRYQPHDVSYLSFSIPGLVDRAAAFGHRLSPTVDARLPS